MGGLHPLQGADVRPRVIRKIALGGGRFQHEKRGTPDLYVARGAVVKRWEVCAFDGRGHDLSTLNQIGGGQVSRPDFTAARHTERIKSARK